MRKVLDPFEPYLDISGISCVDARLKPNTPDGAKYLFKIPPNQSFAVTVENNGSGVKFSYDDLGSITYALRHVNGVDSMNPHGARGNGHIICLGTSLSDSIAIRDALLADPIVGEGTSGGQSVTLMSFDGKLLQVANDAAGVTEFLAYKPQYDILGR